MSYMDLISWIHPRGSETVSHNYTGFLPLYPTLEEIFP
jgi:hypothetical protein